jgi:hypothetical protein
MSTFPIYETHPALANLLIHYADGGETDEFERAELMQQGLVRPDGTLTGIAKLILTEAPKEGPNEIHT